MKFAARVIYAEKRILGAFYEGLLTLGFFSRARAADFIRAVFSERAPTAAAAREDETRRVPARTGPRRNRRTGRPSSTLGTHARGSPGEKERAGSP